MFDDLFGRGNLVYIAIAVAIGVVSFAADLAFGNNWFQRCGAAIVLIAILLQNRALIQIIDVTKTTDRSIFLTTQENAHLIELMVEQSKRKARMADADDILDESEALLKHVRHDFAEETAESQSANRTSLWALALAVIGTAIWGYGDLALCVIFPDKAAECFAP